MKPSEELKIKQFWDKNKICEKARNMRKDAKKFYFLDGPPYASGNIHMGTAWNKILKDVFIRFWRMRGFDVWDQPGYDTHGLPIEKKVEALLKFKSKAEIEKYGIEKFNKQCRKFATEHISTMNSEFADLGVWMDWENAYLTLDNQYIESAWHTFKIAFQKGLLYRGLYPVHICPKCVDPNSMILVENGTRKIKELKNCWKHNKVIAMDTTTKETKSSSPLGYIEDEDDVFLLRTNTGKKLIASSDHPFWTPNGWTPLSNLRKENKVAVLHHVESRLPEITKKGRIILNESQIEKNLEKMETANNGTPSLINAKSSVVIKVKNMVYDLRKQGYSYNKIIVLVKQKTNTKISKSWISKILKSKTKTRYDWLISKLRKRELLPLFSNNSKTFILARILGHVLGDGSLTVIYKKDRTFPIFCLSFSGETEDLEDIKKDLIILGYESSSISTVETRSIVNGREIKGFTTSMRCHASSLAILLIMLGAPIGRKSEIDTDVPKWIAVDKKLTREFLAAYFGSELDIIKTRKHSKGFESLRLHLTKDRKYEENGIAFAKGLCSLINRFGVETSNLRVLRNVVNGKEKSKVTISIKCNDKNLINFSKLLGYEYCRKRKNMAAYALGYLCFKQETEKNQQRLRSKILYMRKSGISCKKLANKLGLNELFVRHVVYGKSKKTRAAKYIPTFHNWLTISSKDLKDGLIWNVINEITHLDKQKVCDIAVDQYHNFITNGFLTHNCETAVAYNEIEYKKMSDPSIFIKFPVVGEEKTFLLIWTTTPWTLLANTGVMANPNAEYVKIRLETKEELILAKDLVEKVFGDKPYKIVEKIKGKKLEGLKYKNPLAGFIDFAKEIEETGYRIVLSEQFVSLEEGTGLVHCAPGHGKEDYKVGIDNKLPVVCHVKLDGTFDEKCTRFSAMNARDANKEIIAELDQRGFLLQEEKIVHDYPCCWRCDSQLLLISVFQWFFKITDTRDRLIEENKKVNWYPDWAKSRFDNWLHSLGDWPISRQRYWGIVLPIWICEKCGKTDVIGSVEELESLGAKVPDDLHRPYIDDVVIKCPCGSDMKRIPDVLDVWFDSSVASWASLGYPKNKELFEKMWPADLNIEGPDQIRGWWNSQLISSMITFDRAPFKNILFHGFMLDSHGMKMAKSKGNIIAPTEVKEKYGRDLLRLYLMSSASWDDYYFNWKNADALSKQFLIIENVFSFVNTYVPGVRTGELKPEDRWILSRMNSLIESATKHYETYHIHKAAEELMNFIINDFSRIYIKIIRDRVWPAYGGDDAAFYTLYTVCKNITRLLSPICPFFAESMHQNVLRRLGETNESTHLCNWPSADISMIDRDIEDYMINTMKIIETANNIRQEKKIKLRWPLNLMIVSSDSVEVKNSVKTFQNVIKQLANVKDVKFGIAPEYREADILKVYLDTEITPELEKEAFVRELVRKAQDMRKKNNMVVKDRIILSIACRPEEIEGFEDMIKKEIGVKSIVLGKLTGRKDSFEFKQKNIELAIEKV